MYVHFIAGQTLAHILKENPKTSKQKKWNNQQTFLI